ncbi:MAG: MBL fold metallo-hydrolase [Clostridia bacterium]|nr:MBL fold metallo-hydrolase [Clostridia bacterium]
MKEKRSKKPLKIIVFIAFAAAVLVFLAANGGILSGLENTLGSKKKKPLDDTPFYICFCDVGQGDCTLAVCGGKSLLIDAGENGYEQKVFNLLNSAGIKKLDYIIATHPHSDHIGGIPEVLDYFGAGVLYSVRTDPKELDAAVTYSAMMNAAEECGARVEEPRQGISFMLGEAKVEFEGPVSFEDENLNNSSAVTKITYGKQTFLICADAEEAEEREIIESGADIDCDVIRIAHHGSAGSSSEAFLEAATPDYCVISCGRDNDYGHPHDAALERMRLFTDDIYRTDLSGSITFTCSGGKMKVASSNNP